MKRKAFKREHKRVQRCLTSWLYVMGLNWYEIEVQFKQRRKEFKKPGGGEVAMRVWADWRYMTITIAINVPCIARLDDRELEKVVVHELVHVLVNEMREIGIDHEERVVTMLTKAFFWVRDHAVAQFANAS